MQAGAAAVASGWRALLAGRAAAGILLQPAEAGAARGLAAAAARGAAPDSELRTKASGSPGAGQPSRVGPSPILASGSPGAGPPGTDGPGLTMASGLGPGAGPARRDGPGPALASGSPGADPPALPGPPRIERRVPLPRLRALIGSRLKAAQNACIAQTVFDVVDMSNIFQMRAEHGERFAEAHSGVKLGFMSAFASAVVLATRPLFCLPLPHWPASIIIKLPFRSPSAGARAGRVSRRQLRG